MVALIRELASRRCRALWLLGLLALTLSAFAAGKPIDKLDFIDMPVPLALKALADVSSTNIVVSPDIKGTITLSLKKVTLEEALTLITTMTGTTYQLRGNTYLVMLRSPQDQAAPVKPQPVNGVSAVVGLSYLSSADAIGALSIAYKDLQVKEIPGRLVLYGDAKQITAAKTFLAEIDVPTKAQQPTQDTPPAVEMAESTYKVKAVVAWQAKAYLEELYKGDGLTVSYAPQRLWTGADTVESTASADAKADATWKSNELILRGPKEVVAQAAASVARIDIDTPLVETRCSVKRIYATQAITYLLERYQARGLTIYTAPMTFAETVSKADGEKETAVKGNAVGAIVRRDKDGALNVSEPIGDFILRGPDDVVKQAVAALATVDVGPERVEKIITLKFLKGADAKKQLDTMYGKEGLQVTLAPQKRGTAGKAGAGASASSSSGSSASASSGSSAGGGAATAGALGEIYDLVLRGPEPVVTRAQSLLSTLDTAPPQVSINSEIVSINSSELKNLGINWSGIAGGTSTPGQVNIGLTESQSNSALNFGRIIRAPIDISATLNALETMDKAKVINRPSTVVQNGEQASIHVGSQFFYAVVSAVTQNGPVYSQQSLDTGVTLQVKPTVSQDGLITLEITTNVTDIPTFRRDVSGLDLPIIPENSSTTVVQVRSGETLVIGGLMQSREEEHRQQVSGLGKLPLVGSLFRSKKTLPAQSELVILVTPSIVGATAPAATAPSAGR